MSECSGRRGGHLPFIVTARPMMHLCWECQQNNIYIYRSANLAEADKSSRLLQQEQHLKIVQQERWLYNSMCTISKKVCRQLGVSESSRNTPSSRQIEMHYSFDYAQQVHLPNDSLQPGPLYFPTARESLSW